MAHGQDHCPRCGADFHCGMADAAPCPCTALTLGGEVLAALRERYAGCLCVNCLSRIAADPAAFLAASR